jgi:hypothetical protein
MNALTMETVERENAAGEIVEVEIVPAYAIIDKVFGAGAWPTWEAQARVVKSFCAAYDAHYYAEPRERFFIGAAAREAMEAGKKIAVVDDLS